MSDKKYTPADVARMTVSQLRRLSDPARAAGVERYFKHTIKTFGTTAVQVRRLAAEYYGSVRRQWSVEDAIALCDILFTEPELESKAVGALVLNRFKRDFPSSLFDRIEGWLARDLLDNWASVDVFCTDGMAALLIKYPELVNRVKTWSRHPNRWVKRASAVSFIKLAGRPQFIPSIYDIALSLFPAQDDLVQKANGWMLRQAGKTDPLRLERFLLRHGPAIPRTTIRYAIERFDQTKRKALLSATRRKA